MQQFLIQPTIYSPQGILYTAENLLYIYYPTKTGSRQTYHIVAVDRMTGGVRKVRNIVHQQAGAEALRIGSSVYAAMNEQVSVRSSMRPVLIQPHSGMRFVARDGKGVATSPEDHLLRPVWVFPGDFRLPRVVTRGIRQAICSYEFTSISPAQFSFRDHQGEYYAVRSTTNSELYGACQSPWLGLPAGRAAEIPAKVLKFNPDGSQTELYCDAYVDQTRLFVQDLDTLDGQLFAIAVDGYTHQKAEPFSRLFFCYREGLALSTIVSLDIPCARIAFSPDGLTVACLGKRYRSGSARTGYDTLTIIDVDL